MRRLSSQILSALFVSVFFGQNVLFADAAESNVWADRREKSTQIASLPSAFRSLPPLQKMPLVSTPVLTQQKPGQTAFDSDLSLIPAQHAMVRDVFRASGSHRPTVFLFQDIHLNGEAQANTAAALDRLIAAGRVSEVGVEGAFGSFNFKRVRGFPDKKAIKTVADAFLKEGLLAAPSYVGMTSDSALPVFSGIDDQRLHTANVDAYRAAFKEKALMEKRAKRDAAELAQEMTSATPALTAFLKLRNDYRNEIAGLGDYLTALAPEKRDGMVGLFLEAWNLERSLDFRRVESERQRVVERLVRAMTQTETDELVRLTLAYRLGRVGFGAFHQHLKDLCASHQIALDSAPAFQNYIRYVLLSDRLSADKLFVEIETLEDARVNALAKTETDKRVAMADDRLYLMKKLAKFELTPKEWERYKLLAVSSKPETSNLRLTAYSLQPFEDFYKVADLRSQKMVDNLLRTNELRTENSKGAFVLITGGFHTSEITTLLRQRDISYAVVTPKITHLRQGSDGQAGAEYLSVFTREKTPLDKLLSGEKLFVNPVEANLMHPATERLVLINEAAQIGSLGPKRQEFPDADVAVERVQENPPAVQVTLRPHAKNEEPVTVIASRGRMGWMHQSLGQGPLFRYSQRRNPLRMIRNTAAAFIGLSFAAAMAGAQEMIESDIAERIAQSERLGFWLLVVQVFGGVVIGTIAIFFAVTFAEPLTRSMRTGVVRWWFSKGREAQLRQAEDEIYAQLWKNAQVPELLQNEIDRSRRNKELSPRLSNLVSSSVLANGFKDEQLWGVLDRVAARLKNEFGEPLFFKMEQYSQPISRYESSFAGPVLIEYFNPVDNHNYFFRIKIENGNPVVEADTVHRVRVSNDDGGVHYELQRTRLSQTEFSSAMKFGQRKLLAPLEDGPIAEVLERANLSRTDWGTPYKDLERVWIVVEMRNDVPYVRIGGSMPQAGLFVRLHRSPKGAARADVKDFPVGVRVLPFSLARGLSEAMQARLLGLSDSYKVISRNSLSEPNSHSRLERGSIVEDEGPVAVKENGLVFFAYYGDLVRVSDAVIAQTIITRVPIPGRGNQWNAVAEIPNGEQLVFPPESGVFAIECDGDTYTVGPGKAGRIRVTHAGTNHGEIPTEDHRYSGEFEPGDAFADREVSGRAFLEITENGNIRIHNNSAERHLSVHLSNGSYPHLVRLMGGLKKATVKSDRDTTRDTTQTAQVKPKKSRWFWYAVGAVIALAPNTAWGLQIKHSALTGDDMAGWGFVLMCCSVVLATIVLGLIVAQPLFVWVSSWQRAPVEEPASVGVNTDPPIARDWDDDVSDLFNHGPDEMEDPDAKPAPRVIPPANWNPMKAVRNYFERRHITAVEAERLFDHWMIRAMPAAAVAGLIAESEKAKEFSRLLGSSIAVMRDSVPNEFSLRLEILKRAQKKLEATVGQPLLLKMQSANKSHVVRFQSTFAGSVLLRKDYDTDAPFLSIGWNEEKKAPYIYYDYPKWEPRARTTFTEFQPGQEYPLMALSGELWVRVALQNGVPVITLRGITSEAGVFVRLNRARGAKAKLDDITEPWRRKAFPLLLDPTLSSLMNHYLSQQGFDVGFPVVATELLSREPSTDSYVQVTPAYGSSVYVNDEGLVYQAFYPLIFPIATSILSKLRPPSFFPGVSQSAWRVWLGQNEGITIPYESGPMRYIVGEVHYGIFRDPDSSGVFVAVGLEPNEDLGITDESTYHYFDKDSPFEVDAKTKIEVTPQGYLTFVNTTGVPTEIVFDMNAYPRFGHLVAFHSDKLKEHIFKMELPAPKSFYQRLPKWLAPVLSFSFFVVAVPLGENYVMQKKFFVWLMSVFSSDSPSVDFVVCVMLVAGVFTLIHMVLDVFDADMPESQRNVNKRAAVWIAMAIACCAPFYPGFALSHNTAFWLSLLPHVPNNLAKWMKWLPKWWPMASWIPLRARQGDRVFFESEKRLYVRAAASEFSVFVDRDENDDADYLNVVHTRLDDHALVGPAGSGGVRVKLPSDVLILVQGGGNETSGIQTLDATGRRLMEYSVLDDVMETRGKFSVKAVKKDEGGYRILVLDQGTREGVDVKEEEELAATDEFVPPATDDAPSSGQIASSSDRTKPLTEDSAVSEFEERYLQLEKELNRGNQDTELPFDAYHTRETAYTVDHIRHTLHQPVRNLSQYEIEDAVLSDGKRGIVVGGDGVGGFSGGEKASKIAVAWVYEQVAAAVDRMGENPSPEEMKDIIKDAILKAHAIIQRCQRSDAFVSHMGTTIFVGVVCGDKLVVGRIGNTRGYIRVGDDVRRVSIDDFDDEDSSLHGLEYAIGMRSGNLMIYPNRLFTLDFPAGSDLLVVSDGVTHVFDKVDGDEKDKTIKKQFELNRGEAAATMVVSVFGNVSYEVSMGGPKDDRLAGMLRSRSKPKIFTMDEFKKFIPWLADFVEWFTKWVRQKTSSQKPTSKSETIDHLMGKPLSGIDDIVRRAGGATPTVENFDALLDAIAAEKHIAHFVSSADETDQNGVRTLLKKSKDRTVTLLVAPADLAAYRTLIATEFPHQSINLKSRGASLQDKRGRVRLLYLPAYFPKGVTLADTVLILPDGLKVDATGISDAVLRQLVVLSIDRTLRGVSIRALDLKYREHLSDILTRRAA